MKLQYLGDTHDFLKYYLLRQLSAVTGRIGVIWMLTPNDQSNDGKVNLHLRKPENYQALDSELHTKLEDIYKGKEYLQIGYLDAIGLIPNARYYERIVPEPGTGSREAYWQGAQSVIQGSGLIFLDPDNGMEIQSTSKNSVKSVRYVYFDEIARLLEQEPVLIYQHFPREERSAYIQKRVKELKEKAGAGEVRVVQTKGVGSFLAGKAGLSEFDVVLEKLAVSLAGVGVKVV